MAAALAAMAWALAPSAGALGQTPAPGLPGPRAAASPNPMGEDYRLIQTRNIFARSRSMLWQTGGRAPVPSSQPAASAPSDEDSLVLTGVALPSGGAPVAFFEDSRGGDPVHVTAGQPIACGEILSISLDGVEYRSGGGSLVRKIQVGENLVAQTGAAGAASQPGEADEDPVLKKMRLKREMELRGY